MRVVLVGHGKMGAMVERILTREGDEILGVVDIGLFQSPMDVPGRADVLIDFSYPGNFGEIAKYAKATGCAVLIGTTGYTAEQNARVRELSWTNAVLHEANYSTGVAALKRAVADLRGLMDAGFDAEIVETHHNQKADAPSGTAKALADALDPDGAYERVYGREGMTGRRGHEIGLHAVRGGNVAGEHSVFFFGENETIEVRHTAVSREVFAVGAVRAARWLCGRAAGRYTMENVLSGE